MKGIELPINILVVVAIAVIVLLGLVALYFIGFNPFSGSVGIESVKNQGCRLLLNQNPPCSNTAITVNWQGNPAYSFKTFMAENYGCGAVDAPDDTCIRQRCTCPGY